jgi:hypothetical protein
VSRPAGVSARRVDDEAGRHERRAPEPSAARPRDPAAMVVQLQRTFGNHAVARWLAATGPRVARQEMPDLTGVGERPGPDSPFYGEYVKGIVKKWTPKDLDEVRAVRADIRGSMFGGSIKIGSEEVVNSASAGLDHAVRLKVMEMLAAFRKQRQKELEKGITDADKRVTAEQELRKQSKEYLDILLDGKDRLRFEHPEKDVNDEVLAALTSQAVGAAEDELAAQAKEGSSKGPESRARAKGGVAKGSWCGAFAFSMLSGSGFDDAWKGHAAVTGPKQGWDLMFDYDQDFWVWSGFEWKSLKAYHKEDRKSERMMTRLPDTVSKADLAGKIRPGDIVLIDNAAGTFADHITMCRSFDMASGRLQTIGGNQPDVEISTRDDIEKNPKAYDAGHTTNAKGEDVKVMKTGRSRVYAVGRLSIVDFETHTYKLGQPADLKAPP